MKFINTLVTFVSLFTSSCMGIEVIGDPTGTDSRKSESHTLTIDVPDGTSGGDLLVLVGSVTEGLLPKDLGGGWEQRASCFKKDNGLPCKSFDEDYTESYDLGQAIYTKEAESNDSSFTFTFDGDLSIPDRGGEHKTWLTLVTLRGAATSDPIRTWKSKGKDDFKWNKFPSIDVKTGDMVLLSMSFDDGYGHPGYVKKNDHFKAPSNFERIAAYVYKDETNMIYAREWPREESTGDMRTRGSNSKKIDKSKDALISLAVKPSGGGGGGTSPTPNPPEKGSCALKTAHDTYINFHSNKDIVDQTTSIGTSEKFELIEKDDYVVVHSPYRNRYLRFGRDRSEVNQQTRIGGWEKFEIIGSLSGTFSLKNKKFQTYLRADRNKNIVDQQTFIGAWEKFKCVPV